MALFCELLRGETRLAQDAKKVLDFALAHTMNRAVRTGDLYNLLGIGRGELLKRSVVFC
jgi:hypothetical protein